MIVTNLPAATRAELEAELAKVLPLDSLLAIVRVRAMEEGREQTRQRLRQAIVRHIEARAPGLGAESDARLLRKDEDTLSDLLVALGTAQDERAVREALDRVSLVEDATPIDLRFHGQGSLQEILAMIRSRLAGRADGLEEAQVTLRYEALCEIEERAPGLGAAVEAWLGTQDGGALLRLAVDLGGTSDPAGVRAVLQRHGALT